MESLVIESLFDALFDFDTLSETDPDADVESLFDVEID